MAWKLLEKMYFFFGFFFLTALVNGKYFENNYNEWCFTKTMKMSVRMKGCRTRIISNNYCYGQCNSYYLPIGLQQNEFGNGLPIMYCTVCTPSSTHVKKVALFCPGKKGKRTDRVKTKKILFVDKCKCNSSKCNYVYFPWWKK